MAFPNAIVIPGEMSITTAVAVSLVIVTAAVTTLLISWFFSKLTPARRRDVITLIRALRGR